MATRGFRGRSTRGRCHSQSVLGHAEQQTTYRQGTSDAGLKIKLPAYQVLKIRKQWHLQEVALRLCGIIKHRGYLDGLSLNLMGC